MGKKHTDGHVELLDSRLDEASSELENGLSRHVLPAKDVRYRGVRLIIRKLIEHVIVILE